MSKNNYPFHLKSLENLYEDTRKDRFVSFLVPVDQDEPGGLKTKEEIRKLIVTDPEEILTFIRMFNSKIKRSRDSWRQTQISILSTTAWR